MNGYTHGSGLYICICTLQVNAIGMHYQMIQILTYLDSLHACLHLKLVHLFSCLDNTVAAAYLSWHCLQYRWRVKLLWCKFSIPLPHHKKQEKNDMLYLRLWMSVWFWEAPLFIHCWGHFKGSVILKVKQHSVGNVTNITHPFTAPLMKRLLALWGILYCCRFVFLLFLFCSRTGWYKWDTFL